MSLAVDVKSLQLFWMHFVHSTAKPELFHLRFAAASPSRNNFAIWSSVHLFCFLRFQSYVPEFVFLTFMHEFPGAVPTEKVKRLQRYRLNSTVLYILMRLGTPRIMQYAVKRLQSKALSNASPWGRRKPLVTSAKSFLNVSPNFLLRLISHIHGFPWSTTGYWPSTNIFPFFFPLFHRFTLISQMMKSWSKRHPALKYEACRSYAMEWHRPSPSRSQRSLSGCSTDGIM